jgi:penicillin amidase
MRTLKYLAVACALLLVIALAAGYALLRASLPRLDGALRQPGVTGAVQIARDARGVATVAAANRADLAFGIGYAHAQDRFFQMDLSRRVAAGQLSELVGKAALQHDRTIRLFRFRTVAHAVMEQATPEERAVVEAYAAGVNAGLASLGARPWEYWVLGQAPLPWRAEDTVLVEFAMWWDLEGNGLRRELLRQEINARLGGPECGVWKCAMQFLYPLGTNFDAPLARTSEEAAPPVPVAVPGAEVLDARRQDSPAPLAGPTASAGPAPLAAAALAGLTPAMPEGAAGSNNWALAGALTTNAAALVASDMHLTQRVPTIWYHARLRLPSSDSAPALDLNGVTLPGAPLLVAGSNGQVAWGYTVAYGNWIDVTRVPCSAVGEHDITTPDGSMALSVAHEEIGVHGEAPVQLDVKSGPAGVLLRVDPPPHPACWFGAWLAQLPEATNLRLLGMERVRSVAEALALAPEIGIPHVNAVLGDRDGHIAWTIFGRIPRNTGPGRALTGAPWTTAEDHPRSVDPPEGRVWTANARVAVDAHQQQLIGGDRAALGADYDLAARARQVRDGLRALAGKATPADMLRIQLDHRALFLARWRELLLSVLDPASLGNQPRRAEFRRLVESWLPEAGIDSVGYRLVREFRAHAEAAVWQTVLEALQLGNEKGQLLPMQFEGPLWQLVNSQQSHLNWLAARYADWPAFLRSQVDATLADLARSCPELSRCTWGERNTARIRHPLSGAMPAPVAALLDMPVVQLPGDHNVPRVQDGDFGASERFAASPGHEADGYLHLPGGQSGHPLSPYYRAGFMEWARGEPLPLLPGPAQHTLSLTP